MRFQSLFDKLINKLESCLSESELGSAWSSINSSKFFGEYLLVYVKSKSYLSSIDSFGE